MNRKPVPFSHVAAAILCCAAAGCTTTESQSPQPSSAKVEKGVLVVPPEVADHYKDPLAASELREKALEVLSTAATSDELPQFRANALEAMSVTPHRLETLIPNAFRDQNPGVRSTAAMMVGRAKLQNIAPAARPLLDDTSPYVRAAAIYALSRCGQSVDPSPMATILLTDPSPRVRAHVAFLLGEMGEPSALGLLREAAKTPMPRSVQAEVRMMQLQIAEAMVKLGDDTQVGTIRAALYPSRPEDLEITALAVQIIGEVHDKGSIDELIFLSARKNKEGQPWPAEIRLGAAGALARMGNSNGTFLADEYAANPDSMVRSQAAFVYGLIGRPENMAKLAVLMEDPARVVRISASAAVLRMTANPMTTTTAAAGN